MRQPAASSVDEALDGEIVAIRPRAWDTLNVDKGKQDKLSIPHVGSFAYAHAGLSTPFDPEGKIDREILKGFMRGAWEEIEEEEHDKLIGILFGFHERTRNIADPRRRRAIARDELYGKSEERFKSAYARARVSYVVAIKRMALAKEYDATEAPAEKDATPSLDTAMFNLIQSHITDAQETRPLFELLLAGQVSGSGDTGKILSDLIKQGPVLEINLVERYLDKYYPDGMDLGEVGRPYADKVPYINELESLAKRYPPLAERLIPIADEGGAVNEEKVAALVSLWRLRRGAFVKKRLDEFSGSSDGMLQLVASEVNFLLGNEDVAFQILYRVIDSDVEVPVDYRIRAMHMALARYLPSHSTVSTDAVELAQLKPMWRSACSKAFRERFHDRCFNPGGLLFSRP